jgi:hypothetical protein
MKRWADISNLPHLLVVILQQKARIHLYYSRSKKSKEVPTGLEVEYFLVKHRLLVQICRKYQNFTKKDQFSKLPLQNKIMYTFISCPLVNNSGLCKGSITNSFRVSLTLSNAPMSSNVTPISSGGMTSARSLFSNSFSVEISWHY